MILEEQDSFLKMKVITGRLHGGHTAFVATSMGLVRWKFLMDPNAPKSGDMTAEEMKESFSSSNDFDIIRIYSNQVECAMSDTHVVYFAQESCEFTVIDLASYTKQHQIQIPATNLDSMAILDRPLSLVHNNIRDLGVVGFKIIALDWSNNRKLVIVDLDTLSCRPVNVPLLGWLEEIVPLPNQ